MKRFETCPIFPAPNDGTRRLVALDLDGTLLTSDKRVTEASRAVLASLNARGVHVVLVTGRNVPMTERVAAVFPYPVTLIAHNGAWIADSLSGEIRLARTLSRETADALIATFRERNCEPMLYTYGDGKHLLRHCDVARNPSATRYLAANREVCAPADGTLLPDGFSALHLFAIEPTERVKAVLDEIRSLDGAKVMTSGGLYGGECWFLEAVHADASKLNALRWVCERRGIALSEVVAIGDNLNDMELLENVGHGVAMGNAPDAVKSVARSVTASCDEEGVALALSAVFG